MAKQPITTKVNALATAIASDIKSINNRTGQLTSLHEDFATATANGNIMAAINHTYSLAKTANSAAGAKINDSTESTSTTYSSTKIKSVVAAEVASVVDGAPAAFDTLKEVATWIEGKADAITAINNKVPFNEVKSITDEQKGFVWQTVGIGDIDVDFVETYNAAKA